MAAVSTRVVQLLILVVITQATIGEERNVLVVGIALLSAAAVLSDTGAGNYLLSHSAPISRSAFYQVLGCQVGFAFCGASASLMITAGEIAGSGGTSVHAVLIALACSQILDSATRVARSPHLITGNYSGYARADFLLCALKFPAVALVHFTDSLEFLFLAPIASAIVFVASLYATAKSLPKAESADFKHTFRSLLHYGISGSASAFYSQAPMVVGAVILPVEIVSPIALAYRVVQPLEVLPATASQQVIPRVRSGNRTPLWYWSRFSIGGSLLAVVVLAVSPYIFETFFHEDVEITLILLLMLSVPVKFGNYALVAILLAKRRPEVRLFCSVVVGIIAIGSTALLGFVVGSNGLALASLISELLLASALGLGVKKTYNVGSGKCES
ncbi:hypothetical protein ACFTZB_27200 [Rhodococcus sp. NPDC057014]|uniref:hypothetical protein n=1 Tax=Rhodococcus sp. NPDC057014 TaxID=3346000 RepID=UPI0036435616